MEIIYLYCVQTRRFPNVNKKTRDILIKEKTKNTLE